MNSTTLHHDRDQLLAAFRSVRGVTEAIAAPLSYEDQCVQSMPDASPVKWHRAHTTWFFETFILVPEMAGYRQLDERYSYLFNSYYEAVGARHARAERGLLTRPSCEEVAEYRAHVDNAMERFMTHETSRVFAQAAPRIELGLHHEQQHQELLLMDIKHALSRNCYDNQYCDSQYAPTSGASNTARALEFTEHSGGIIDIGASDHGFSFDNEGPMHTALVQPFALANRLVTAGEWKAFIEDDGYQRAELWLSDGWGTAQREGWNAPLYWEQIDGDWSTLTMHGVRAINDEEPVVHVSFYEADAFARWSDARLPTEVEWESVTSDEPIAGNLLDGSAPLTSLHPRASTTTQYFGDVWEWTGSAYLPYPRFTPAAGAIGEYNGKFMSNQMVLRGGSFATPESHIRSTYRNFFYPHQRWMFAGVRLARDVEPN